MVDSPSFLREELEAFDRIYTELLSAPPSRRPSCEESFLTLPPDDLTELTNLAVAWDTCASRARDFDDLPRTELLDLSSADPPDTGTDCCHEERDILALNADEMDLTRFFRSKSKRGSKRIKGNPFHTGDSHTKPGCLYGDTIRGIYGLNQGNPATVQENPSVAPPDVTSTNLQTPHDPSVSALSLRRSRIGTGDKLFLDLLDDLDRISENTPSSRRRTKARDLFAEWLFSQNQGAAKDKALQKKLNRKSFSEYASHAGVVLEQHDRGRRNSDGSKDQLDWQPRSESCVDFNYEDDTDSGYHTAHSTLKGQSDKTKPSPGERTLSREELRKKIEAFNTNQHGLLMTLEMGCTSTLTPNGQPSSKSVLLQEPDTTTFQGFIRVYMNLMRPISMSLPARPPSIYDVMGNGDDPEPTDTLTTSFYLPKDTTKVIHISSETTASEVIRALLQKFKITDNPRKFALYEKVEEEGLKAIMRRVSDEECPLQLCLSWTAEGLNNHKFVLQENDTGEIMWEAFSIPELDNFLRILDREEEEYIEQVKAKYQLLKIQTHKQLKRVELERSVSAPAGTVAQAQAECSDSKSKSHDTSPDPDTVQFAEDSREPVFV